MKVLSIRQGRYCSTEQLRGQIKGNINFQQSAAVSYPQNSNDLTLSCDTVSFKKRHDTPFLSDMRELPNLNCACCGIKMMKNSEANSFMNKKIYYPARISLKRIKSEHYFNESRASDSMKQAYAYLSAFAEKNPNLTMDDILSKRAVKEARKDMPKEVSEAFDELREMTKLVARTSKYMVETIRQIHPDFHRLEKRVFKELQSLAQKYPNETFYDILNKPEINKFYLENLKKKQMDILDKASFAAETAPSDIKEKIDECVLKARDIFKNEHRDVFHKRGRVITMFNELLKDRADIPEAAQILDIINQLPDSKTDVDAFMIKGAQKSSNAIVEILISRIRNTYEHVKPHRRIGDNGPNSIYNYIALCGKCNGQRQRTEYDIFVNSHPEMIENTQKQVDKIIYFINSGLLIKHDKYPQEIKKALATESKGKILININKLDLKQAKTNRIIRENLYIAAKKQQAKEKKIFKIGKGFFPKKKTS